MYGGHITDDWDRRLCRTYLEEFIRPEMLEGELSLAPGFPLPGNMDYSGYHQVRPCFVCSDMTVMEAPRVPPVWPAQLSMHELTLRQDWEPGKDAPRAKSEYISTSLSAPRLPCSTQEAQDFQPQIKNEIELGDLCNLDV